MVLPISSSACTPGMLWVTSVRVLAGHKQTEVRVDGRLRSDQHREEAAVGGEVGGKTQVGRTGPVHRKPAEPVSDDVGGNGHVGGRRRRCRRRVLHRRAPDKAGAGEARAAGDRRRAGRARAEA